MKLIRALLLGLALVAGFAAPTHAAVVDSTTLSSNATTTKTCTVPTGVQADDILILAMTTDAAGNVDSGHYPTGFVELAEVDLTHDNQLGAVAWKRATGADAGTYVFLVAVGGSNWVCQVIALRGRHATDPPVASTPNPNNTNNTTPTANGVTALAHDDLVWISFPDVNTTGGGNGHTPPSGYAEQEDDENAFSNLSMATLLDVAAGATGTVAGTFALSAGTAGTDAILVRVPEATVPPTGNPLTRRRSN